MSSHKPKDSWKLFLSVAWLGFTVAFAIWWFMLSMDHVSRLEVLQPDHVAHWARQKRMIFWEGISWIILLSLGGAALIALVYKEKLRAKQIREFFASFSHEVKTSLASLRLQAESLKEDLGASQNHSTLDRLIADTVRLQVQLENSLFLSSQENLKLFLQPLQLRHFVERLQEQWPAMVIRLKSPQSVIVQGDERALRTIFSNLAQNSFLHGRASEIEIEVMDGPNGVRIQFRDNGSGFKGDVTQLGQLFHRPVPSSGSGLGLYISKALLSKMGGQMEFDSTEKGLNVIITLPKGSAL